MASHWFTPPRPVKARDPELASTTGSGVLEPEDPVFAFGAAPTVVGVGSRAVVFEPGAVVGPSLVGDASAAEAGLVLVGSVPVPTIVVGVDDTVAGHPGGDPVLPSAW